MKTYRVQIPKNVITKVLVGSKNFIIHLNDANKNPCKALVQNTLVDPPVETVCGVNIDDNEVQNWTAIPAKADLYLFSPNSIVDVIVIDYDDGTIDPGITIIAQLPEA